ncbi:hypothetical protein H009_02428 [Agrobacterium tumefaciens str. Cherry 2E-2-2]|nr:hypothetical protein H009_02428 [Agrobacterium tumefaciens str. Cherry 2E-2-2]
MALVYSTGPLLQRYLVALLTSDETSIYGSAFQQQAVSLPRLNDWFGAAIAWPFPFISLIVVLLSASSPSIKQIFLKLSLFGFATLTVFDFGYSLLNNTISIPSVFENIVINFVGSIGAAAIAAFLLAIANYGFCSFHWSIWPRRAIAGLLVVLGSALALCVIYYLTDFFYRPRPAKIDLMAEAPSHGFIIAKSTSERAMNFKAIDGQSDEQFSLISQVDQSSSLNWRAPKNAKISWSTEDRNQSGQIEISLYTGCGPSNSTPNLPENTSVFRAAGVLSLSLWHDWGAWDTTIIAENENGASELSGTDASFFSIDPSSKGDGLDLQQMAANNSIVTYSGGTDPLEVFMITPPAKPEEAKEAAPSLHVNVDGVEHVIRVTSSADYDSAETVSCSPAPTIQSFEKRSLDLGASSLAGIRVRISPTLRPGALPNNVVKMSGDGGFLTIKTVDTKSLRTNSAKRIDMVALSGNLKSATVNGSERALKSGDEYVAIGDNIKGSFVSGILKISGSAELLWENNVRANQTKWEILPIEYKIALFACLSSAFLWIGGRALTLIGNTDELAWLEDGIPGGLN